MELQDQKKDLSRMLIALADKITMMETRRSHRPAAVNVTISAEKVKIVKFMLSVRTSQRINNLVAISRVSYIPILE